MEWNAEFILSGVDLSTPLDSLSEEIKAKYASAAKSESLDKEIMELVSCYISGSISLTTVMEILGLVKYVADSNSKSIDILIDVLWFWGTQVNVTLPPSPFEATLLDIFSLYKHQLFKQNRSRCP